MTAITDLLGDYARDFGLVVTSEIQAALPPALRDLHRAVLRAFLDTGDPPTATQLHAEAERLGLDPREALASLADHDMVHLADGTVTVAYPFSGIPTPHRVELVDAPPVWAMCAIDALGIPLMTGRDGRIRSADPTTGRSIHVSVRGGRWEWDPDTAVTVVAATAGCATAADACCRTVNFYESAENANAFLAAAAGVTGQVLGRAESVEAAGVVFGSLLGR